MTPANQMFPQREGYRESPPTKSDLKRFLRLVIFIIIVFSFQFFCFPFSILKTVLANSFTLCSDDLFVKEIGDCVSETFQFLLTRSNELVSIHPNLTQFKISSQEDGKIFDRNEEQTHNFNICCFLISLHAALLKISQNVFSFVNYSPINGPSNGGNISMESGIRSFEMCFEKVLCEISLSIQSLLSNFVFYSTLEASNYLIQIQHFLDEHVINEEEKDVEMKKNQAGFLMLCFSKFVIPLCFI